MKPFLYYVACFGSDYEYPFCQGCPVQKECWQVARRKIEKFLDDLMAHGQPQGTDA